MKEFHSSHASGLGDGVYIQSKVPDEQQQTVSGTNEGAGEDDEDNDEHNSANDNDDDDEDQENVGGEIESDDEGDDFVHPNLSTYKAYDQEEEKEEEKANDDDEMDIRDAEMTDAQTNQEKEEVHVTLTTEPLVEQQQSSSVSSDLVTKFINPTLDTVPITTVTPSSDTIIHQSPIPITQPQQQTHDSPTTTPIPTTSLPKIPNFASLFSFEQRVSSLETELSILKQSNPFAEAISAISGIVDGYLAYKMKDAVDVDVQLKSDNLREEAQVENQEFLNSLDSNIKRIIKEEVKAQTSKIMSKVEKYVTETLGAEVLVRSTNQPQTSYAVASSLSELELKKILLDKMEENKSIDRSEVQKNLYNALVEAYNSDKDLVSSYGDVMTLKRGRKEELSKETTQKESKSTSSSKGASRSQPQPTGKSAQAEEHATRVDDLKEPFTQEFNTGNDDVSPVRERIDVDERLWNPSGSRTPDRKWHKTKTVDDRPPQPWMTQLAQASGTQSSFNEYMATPINFSAFIMNRLKIENLTQDVLTGPTYDLIKGSCKSVAVLEYHLEEVFKATNDQLDWNNHEGRPYPHDISKPLPLIPNGRSRQVIPFDHFINNNLEYLKGGSLSKKYTTSITKTKAADYGQIKWIEDKIPRSTWSTIPIDMNRNRLMRTDELHKFSDGTLTYVRIALNDIATGIQMEYLPNRRWTKQDKQRARMMINAIDKKLRDGRLMRSLEKFVGGRPYGGDLRLLERTI
ncbi:hypothetical protein Tco_1577259 [Tanacetum coccineum]